MALPSHATILPVPFLFPLLPSRQLCFSLLGCSLYNVCRLYTSPGIRPADRVEGERLPCLDANARQPFAGQRNVVNAARISLFAGAGGIKPVSYTHLDVYKRQVYNSVFLPYYALFKSIFFHPCLSNF